MNQRASHFQLGNSSVPLGSTYHHHYPPKQVPFQQHKQNPFRSSSLPSNEKGNFLTTNKALYKAWDHIDVAKLQPAKLSELKTHHFKLGTYAPGHNQTTHQLYHNKKEITGQASQFQQESKNKMRAHYHDFKEQNFTNYKSNYAQQYTPKQRVQNEAQPKQKQSSNAICFGNNQLPFVTTSTADYVPKKAEVVNGKNQQTLGVKLGSDKIEPMQTMNQHYFDRKQGGPSKLPQSTMKELRSTHFQLGQMQNIYQTQSNYYKPHLQQNATSTIPVYQSGTWVNKNQKFNGTTTYQRELKARQVQPFTKASQQNKNGIELGKHKDTYETQFKSNYNMKGVSGSNRVQVKPQNNVTIGSGPNYWVTQHKSSFQPKEPSYSQNDIAKTSKQDHFSIGGSSQDPKLTVYQDEHRTDLNNRSKLFHRDRS